MRIPSTAVAICGLALVFPGPAVAEAQKITVALLAASNRQAPLAGKITAAIDDNLARSRDLLHWRELVSARAPSAAQEATLKQKVDEAVGMLKSNDTARAPIAEIQQAMRGAAPTASTQDIQGAQALLGAIAWVLGDVPTAEARLVEALSYDPSLRPLEVTEPPGFAQLWERARFEVNEHARGELSITSDPPGARVVIDGAFRGTAPLAVQGLSAGPHLVQADLFGYGLAGEIVKVKGPETPLNLRLPASEIIAETDVRNALIAAAQNENGRLLAELGRKLDVNYIVAGWLNPKGSSLVLSMAAVRVDNGKVLASQDLTIEQDEFAQAGVRAAALANLLLEGKTGGVKGNVEKKSKPRDPLEGKDGTEDW